MRIHYNTLDLLNNGINGDFYSERNPLVIFTMMEHYDLS